MIEAKIIPSRLREAREAAGFNAKDFANKLGISRQAVFKFETGQSEPKGETFQNIVELVNQNVSFFYKNPPRDTTSPIFWRSLKRLDKDERTRVEKKIDFGSDVVSLIDKYIELPDVDLPKINNFNYESTDGDEIEKIADKVREVWGLGQGPIDNLVNVLESKGIIIVSGKVNSLDMDALSAWRFGRPILFISAEKKIAVRSRFNLAHELGHLILHRGFTVNEKNINNVEKQAHRFASAFLLPRNSFGKEVFFSSLDHFVTLKKRWKVSISAMNYRCGDLKIFTPNQVSYIWRQMRSRDWWGAEPLDKELEEEKPTVLNTALELILREEIQSAQDILDETGLKPLEIENLCMSIPGTLDQTHAISIGVRKLK